MYIKIWYRIGAGFLDFKTGVGIWFWGLVAVVGARFLDFEVGFGVGLGVDDVLIFSSCCLIIFY